MSSSENDELINDLFRKNLFIDRLIASVKADASDAVIEQQIKDLHNNNSITSNKQENEFEALSYVFDAALATVKPPTIRGELTLTKQKLQQLESNTHNNHNNSSSNYEADDEALGEQLLFPCHQVFDECHPMLLHNYYPQKSTISKTTQFVRYPRLLDCLINYCFTILRQKINDEYNNSMQTNESIISDSNQNNFENIKRKEENNEDENEDIEEEEDDTSEQTTNTNLNNYQQQLTKQNQCNTFIKRFVHLIERMSMACKDEKLNCKVLSQVPICDKVLRIILFLVKTKPNLQQLFLEPMLIFALQLLDCKANGNELRLLFCITKEEFVNLETVLLCIRDLLISQKTFLRHIKPALSINFPTASKTAEEIELNSYDASSWHYRVRKSVIEFKQRESRLLKQPQNNNQQQQQQQQHQNKQSDTHSISSSWLESSLIIPLSSISQLLGGKTKCFSCSLWLSVCGNLLVVNNVTTTTTPPSTSNKFNSLLQSNSSSTTNSFSTTTTTASHHNSYWTQLESLKKRSASKLKTKDGKFASRVRKSRSRSQSKTNHQQVEHEDIIHHQQAIENQNIDKQQQQQLYNKQKNQQQQQQQQQQSDDSATAYNNNNNNNNNNSNAFSSKRKNQTRSRRANSSPQAHLMHIISFAIDTLTIELWLNVKTMRFLTRACRVVKGQNCVLSEASFPSRLEANGSWTHVILGFEEVDANKAKNTRSMLVESRINGVYSEGAQLSYPAYQTPTNFACLLGCERQTFGYMWKLSQLFLFKGQPARDVCLYLQGKGPDFWSLPAQHQGASTLPLGDLMQRSFDKLLNFNGNNILKLYGHLNYDLALAWIAQNIQAAFGAQKFDYFADYSSPTATSTVAAAAATTTSSNMGSCSSNCSSSASLSNAFDRFLVAKVLNFARNIKFNANKNLSNALIEAGGVESVLMCFADAQRRAEDSSNIHALATSVLFEFVQSNDYHLNRFFDELNGLELVSFSLSQPNCLLSIQLLDVYTSICFVRVNKEFVIKSARLLFYLLNAWKAWHKDLKVAEHLYTQLKQLLQPERPFLTHNLKMMNDANALDMLLSILKESLISSADDCPKINKQTIELLISLIDLIVGRPPSLHVINELMEFLLLLHPESESFVGTISAKSSYLYPLKYNSRSYYALDDASDANEYLSSSELESSYLPSSNTNSLEDLVRTMSENNERNNRHRRQVVWSRDSLVDGITNDDNAKNNSHLQYVDLNTQFEQQQQQQTNRFTKLQNINYNNNDNIDEDDENDEYNNNEFNDDEEEDEIIIEGNSNNIRNNTSNNNTNNFNEFRRSLAIAQTADLVSKLVKIALKMSPLILTSALQNGIIDLQVLIVMANNPSQFVREEVLRLFLHCARACRRLNLGPQVNKFEFEAHGYQLLAHQLMRYPTTLRMIELCFGIINGIDDFEFTFVCLFDFDVMSIGSISNNLKLNSLILLIQLMSKLQVTADIVLTVQFLKTYLQQLMNNNRNDIISILIDNNLIESLMKIYFAYVEKQVTKSAKKVRATTNTNTTNNNLNHHHHHYLLSPQSPTSLSSLSMSSRNNNNTNNTWVGPANDHASLNNAQCKTTEHRKSVFKCLRQEWIPVIIELDKCIVLLVRYYFENLSTNEALSGIEGLLRSFDLMNAYVPVKFHNILRDRKVVVLTATLTYIRYYECCAKANSKNNYLRNIIRGVDLRLTPSIVDADISLEMFFAEQVYPYFSDLTSLYNAQQQQPNNDNFSNATPNPTEHITTNTEQQTNLSSNNNQIKNELENQEVKLKNDNNATINNSNEEDCQILKELIANRSQSASNELSTKCLNARDIKERVQSTLSLVVDFLTIRESDIYTSSTEKQFTLNFVKLLIKYLDECQLTRQSLATNRSFRLSLAHRKWHEIFVELTRKLKELFAMLILYLISPAESMGQDERNYYAYSLAQLETPEKLVSYLDDNSSKKQLRLFVTFIRDLCHNSDDLSSDIFEVNDKINALALKAVFLIETNNNKLVTNTNTNETKNLHSTPFNESANNDDYARSNSAHLHSHYDSNLRSVWLEALKCNLDKNHSATIALLETNLAMTQEMIALRDEADKITQTVNRIKDKERKQFMFELKQNKIKNYFVRQQWLSIVVGQSHERATWYLRDWYPKSWELNPVEGPSRIRQRLKPCKLLLEDRFFRSNARHFKSNLNNYQTANNLQKLDTNSILPNNCQIDCYSTHPLCGLFASQDLSIDSKALRVRMFTTERVIFNCACSVIRPTETCEGEISIASWCIHIICELKSPQVTATNNNINSNFIETYNTNTNTTTNNNKHLWNSTTTTNEVECNQFISKRSMSNNKRQTTPLINLTSNTLVEDLWFDEIVEIWFRRYQLQDVALEIFLTNNMTYLISFQSTTDRMEFFQKLKSCQHKLINLQKCSLSTNLTKCTQLWRDGKMTNFDFLTKLNKLAGRSFNDLMQYPVFPFVLSNYISQRLDLTDETNFRRFDRPMAIQNPERENGFIEQYEILKQDFELKMGVSANSKAAYQKVDCTSPAIMMEAARLADPSPNILLAPPSSNSSMLFGVAASYQLVNAFNSSNIVTSNNNVVACNSGDEQSNANIGGLCGVTKPYHYGNHYSNSASVLHFLVRLPPFTQLLIKYQDNNFDLPDRTFHSLASTWQLITRDSSTDFKELIPEFFFLPEMFVNSEQLELGRKQNNELVDNVVLPNWCRNGDARLFTLIHRQALESRIVSKNLHSWIDLIFGYKQTSKAAVDAINVFHPATYYGVVSPQRPNSTSVANSISQISSSQNKSSLFGSSDGDESSPIKSNSKINKQQAIESLALQTMIKTYGQMPRQLFYQAVQPKNIAAECDKRMIPSTSSSIDKSDDDVRPVLTEVKGLRWGSFVGSPEEGDPIAVNQMRVPASHQSGGTSNTNGSSTSSSSGVRLMRRIGAHLSLNSRLKVVNLAEYSLQLLPNDDVAILRGSTSLLLDYRADKKQASNFGDISSSQSALSSSSSSTSTILPSFVSRQTGLKSVARMNLFSHMIISRQRTTTMLLNQNNEHSNSSTSGGGGGVSSNSEQTTQINSNQKTKFSLNSLSLISWAHFDGIVRIKYPANANDRSYNNKPLIQADSPLDSVSTCASVPELNLLLVGYISGAICSHVVSSSRQLDIVSSRINTQANNITINTRHKQVDSNELQKHFSLSFNKSKQGKQNDFLTSKTSRWLYCHSSRVNCMSIDLSFGIVATGSDDGTCVLWDLNSLTYIRTIDYRFELNNSKLNTNKLSDFIPVVDFEDRFKHITNDRLLDYLCSCSRRCSLSNDNIESFKVSNYNYDEENNGGSKSFVCDETRQQQSCSICTSGVSMAAISETLGDIATIKHINYRLAAADDSSSNGSSNELVDKQLQNQHSQHKRSYDLNSINGKQMASILYVHTINGTLVGFVHIHEQVTAVCYSNAPEGLSVNVVVVGLANGAIHMYSSWDLSKVKEVHISGFTMPVSSLLYSRDNQYLFVISRDGQLIVLRNKLKQANSLASSVLPSPPPPPKLLFLF